VTSLATTNANAISEYGPSTTAVLGTQASGSPFTFANVTTGTLDIQSHSLSIGPTNDLLLVEENNHAFRVAFTSGSYSSSALALFAGNINAANSIAENGVGNILLANSGFNPPNISAFSNTTGNLTNYIQTANADAQFMALSYNGSAYTIGQQDGLVTYANFGNYSTFANTTSYLAYALAGANAPIQPEVDGLSNVWAPNVASGACTVSKYLFGTGNIYPSGLAINNCSNEGLALGEVGIDPSGNLWVSVLQNGSAFSGYVTEVLGVAAPTITPLSLQTLKEVPTNTSMDIRP
jgi:hypothetical protein